MNSLAKLSLHFFRLQMYIALCNSDRNRRWSNTLNTTPVNMHKLHQNLKKNSIKSWIIGTSSVISFLTSPHWKNFKHFWLSPLSPSLFTPFSIFSNIQSLWKNYGKYPRLPAYRFSRNRSKSRQADKNDHRIWLTIYFMTTLLQWNAIRHL